MGTYVRAPDWCEKVSEQERPPENGSESSGLNHFEEVGGKSLPQPDAQAPAGGDPEASRSPSDWGELIQKVRAVAAVEEGGGRWRRM